MEKVCWRFICRFCLTILMVLFAIDFYIGILNKLLKIESDALMKADTDAFNFIRVEAVWCIMLCKDLNISKHPYHIG